MNLNIGQAAEASGVSAKMIRYYEEIGLISEASRTESGYRQYTDKEVQTLLFVRHSRDLGFSIDRIRTLLALWNDTGRKSADVKKLANQYVAELDEDILKLQRIRDQLKHLAASCKGNNRPACPIIDELASVTISA
jgi:MerR family copper efflux transcriptional regulator